MISYNPPRLRNKVFHTRADWAMVADHVKNNVSMYHYGGSVDHASFLSGLDLPGVQAMVLSHENNIHKPFQSAILSVMDRTLCHYLLQLLS